MKRNSDGQRSQDHTHVYELVNVGSKGYQVYRCVLPNCTHYIQPQFVSGKVSLCFMGCNKEVIIPKDAVSRKVKHFICEQCKEERRQRIANLRNLGKVENEEVKEEEELKEEIQ